MSMKIRDWFENWGITGLKLSTGFLEMEWEPQPEEQQAAWELYIELITRITTQDIDGDSGDEAAIHARAFPPSPLPDAPSACVCRAMA